MGFVHLLTVALVCASELVAGANVQKRGLQVPRSYNGDRKAVRDIFETSYAAYRKYAFGHDDLTPVTKNFTDPRNGWGASIVDAMTTMYIMGFDDWFKEAVDFSSKIDFSSSQTSDDVSLFETTIRYVGGFISAYELSDYRHPILVKKAKEITDYLTHGFNGSVGVPFGFITLQNGTATPVNDTSNIAEAGTLSLEWDRLSKYTHDDTYRRLAVGSAAYITQLPAPLPGLAAQGINPANGSFVGSYVTWGGGSDSYFEYLLKYPRLTNSQNNFTKTWQTAVDSSIKYLQSTSTVGDWTYLADITNAGKKRFISSHLACFHGGNWIMGGRLLNNQTIFDLGIQLTDACWNTYAGTETGIGPEVFAWISPEGNYTGANTTADDLAFYNEHGFYIYNGYSYYDLRPEVLESNFYAWRATGETKYLDRAKSAYKSFNAYLKAPAGYAGIEDVRNTTSEMFDNMESFWLAEVLKYLYLTFDDPNHISLDEWVFNTEAHPFKAPPTGSYGHFPWPSFPKPPHHPSPRVEAWSPAISPIARLPSKLKQLREVFVGF